MSDEVADMGSQLSATSSSSCYTVNRVGRELDNNQDFRGSVTIRVTAGRDYVEEKEKEERRSRFEAEKEAVMRIYSSSLHNTLPENGKVQNTISKGGSGQERERRERRRREGKKEKRDKTGEGEKTEERKKRKQEGKKETERGRKKKRKKKGQKNQM